MNNYIPFLKLKPNEVMAIKELDLYLQNRLTPFFDFPRGKNNMTEEKFVNKVDKAVKSVTKHLGNISNFYIDNFDIDSQLTINGKSNYKYILEQFSSLPIIPVFGLDRSDSHIDAIMEAKNEGLLNSDQIGIRITREDFQDFKLIEDDIEEIINKIGEKFNKFDIILDCRVCLNQDINSMSMNIINFIKEYLEIYKISKIIITGSSIPSSISEIISTNNDVEKDRNELIIFDYVYSKINHDLNIFFGDYGIVSPDYSDINIKDSLIRTVTAPKVFYSFNKKHYIIRGKGLQQYGNSQYNDIAKIIVVKSFYRGSTNSYGDKFLHEKSLGIGSQVGPGSILKPTINAHITYMLTDYIY